MRSRTTSTLALLCWAATFVSVLVSAAPTTAGQRGGQLELRVVDRDSGEPLACRLHLENGNGRAVALPGAARERDYVLVDGQTTLRLPLGAYRFSVERGPEYLVRRGQFTIVDFADDSKVVDLKRIANLAQESWWSGDLDVRRAADIELAMRAEDLHLAQLITWSNQRSRTKPPARSQSTAVVGFDNNRFYGTAGGADFRAGGSLLLLGFEQPLKLPGAKSLRPTSLAIIEQARERGHAWIDVANPASWDLPLWLALARVDSIELAASGLGRQTAAARTAGKPAAEKLVGVKPADPVLFPGPSGQAKWCEAIYYHLLNCGFRIPPSAGSGSGDTPSPVGANRAYVHLDGEFTWDKWWEGLRDGRVVVTNGPLLRPSVEGMPPGHVFQADAGQKVELEIALTLSTQEHIEYLEVIQNGRLAHEVRLDAWAKAGGHLPPLVFEQSGWFLVRAVTDVDKTYRFASSGPYYVEIGYKKQVSKASAQLFLDWLNERAAQLASAKATPEMLEPYERARKFWEQLASGAEAP